MRGCGCSCNSLALLGPRESFFMTAPPSENIKTFPRQPSRSAEWVMRGSASPGSFPQPEFPSGTPGRVRGTHSSSLRAPWGCFHILSSASVPARVTPLAPTQVLGEEDAGLQLQPSSGWDGEGANSNLKTLPSPCGVPGSGKVPYFLMLSEEETVKGEMWPEGS